MKAKQRTLVVLILLILLAGGMFALLTMQNAKAEQAASAAADGTIPLAAVSGNDLTQIVLHYQGETNTLDYTTDGWTLAEDPAYHLDPSACNTMLTALSSLNDTAFLQQFIYLICCDKCYVCRFCSIL